MSQAEMRVTQQPDVAEIARSQAYMLLSVLLAAPPDADLLARLRGLAPDGSRWGAHLADIARVAAMSPADVEREFNRLFIGLDRGELVPYASWYLTGFLQDRPLVALRDDMARLGIARSGGAAEPEDHAAGVLEIMAGLLAGRFPAASPSDAAAFHARHIAPWLPRFLDDLQGAEAAVFYRPVAALGRLLMEIEKETMVPATAGTRVTKGTAHV
ncbi:TorD/DmsD family molecular chaperone [Halodurantibacterium flavum]|uniref:Molecular chaperone n=1 Tax=Halodurantibacterium flavum TaxID=1382802 RepID=A0ABW4S5V9_9RHOB